METKPIKSAHYLVIIVMLLTVAGCAANRNISTVSDISIQEDSTNEFIITDTKAYVDDGVFVVSGKLKRKNVHRSYPGHVDVAVTSTDEKVIDHVGTKLNLPFLGRSKRKNSSFNVHFKQAPPSGSTVSVKFHKKTYMDSKQIDCDFNAHELTSD